jgi:hypothetical protein
MMQPFTIFTENIINRLIRLERFYLVSQTYTRVESEGYNLLLTDYTEIGGAKIHLNAVNNDRWASIINLQKETHKKKLEEMLKTSSHYNIYFAVVPSATILEKKLSLIYRDRLRRYVEQNTNWRLEEGGHVNASVQLTFGELYVIIKHFNQQIRVRLEEIEAMPI